MSGKCVVHGLGNAWRRILRCDPEQHALAKELFLELVNKSHRQRESRLGALIGEQRTRLKYAIWNRSGVLLADWQYSNSKAGLVRISLQDSRGTKSKPKNGGERTKRTYWP